jgi:orotate phosphoribosyltransferase
MSQKKVKDSLVQYGLNELSKYDKKLYQSTIGLGSVWEYLLSSKVAMDGHFVFSNGGHGDRYINIRDLNTIELLSPIAMQTAFYLLEEKIDAIIGTPHGADTLAVLVAYYYSMLTGYPVEVLKLLKDGNDNLIWYKDHGMRVKNAYIFQIEDVVNSAKSLCETANFIKQANGISRGFVTVCNRISDKNPGLSVLMDKLQLDLVIALTEIEVVNYDVDIAYNPQEQCPFCANGIALNKRVGHGIKFLAQIKDKYPQLYTQLNN